VVRSVGDRWLVPVLGTAIVTGIAGGWESATVGAALDVAGGELLSDGMSFQAGAFFQDGVWLEALGTQGSAAGGCGSSVGWLSYAFGFPATRMNVSDVVR